MNKLYSLGRDSINRRDSLELKRKIARVHADHRTLSVKFGIEKIAKREEKKPTRGEKKKKEIAERKSLAQHSLIILLSSTIQCKRELIKKMVREKKYGRT